MTSQNQPRGGSRSRPAPMRAALALLVAALGAAAAGCGARSGGADAAHAAADDPVTRGQYLVTVGGCNDCHTPFKPGPHGPEPDLARRLSGHPADLALPPAPAADGPWIWFGAATNTAFAGPWGVTFAANLTPHETGLGVWTEDIFIRALRTGKHMGAGRPILPPMPAANYGQMTDADLKAVFAYLRSLPPVANAVPDWRPPEGDGAAGLAAGH